MMIQKPRMFLMAPLHLIRILDLRAVALGACFAAVLAVPAEAQVVRGQVMEDQTGNAIPIVDVSILDADGNVLRTTTSDAQGAFMIGTRASGEYQLQAQRLGFEPVTTEALELHRDSIVDVVIRMSSEAIALDPLEVIGRGESEINRATFEGLYQRRARTPSVGRNRVWVRSDPEMDQAMSVERFLQLHAVRLGRSGSTPGDDERGIRPEHGCDPTVLVRGLEVPFYFLEEFMDRRVYELEGIEVYARLVDAPLALRPTDHWRDCGIVVIWPRQRGDEPW